MRKLPGILACGLVVTISAALPAPGLARHAADRPGVLAIDQRGSALAVERERARLFETLKNARSEQAGRAAEEAIWLFWMHNAPDAETEALVSRAMERREAYDFEAARLILDEVVAGAPDYAEGWNQRAFIHFLQEKLDKALEDLDRALELEPKHFGALAGKARILMQQGRFELGQKVLREAVEIHPWLKERGMLIPVPAGQKI